MTPEAVKVHKIDSKIIRSGTAGTCNILHSTVVVPESQRDQIK
jgi:hypothetical protein